jgi:hypothetical protein
MRLEDLPGRVFLDTCVVNFILDYGEQIHDGVDPPLATDDRSLRDIAALRDIFHVGQRAQWQLAVSPHSYQEVLGTTSQQRRTNLDTWVRDIWQYWRDVVEANNDLPTFIEAEHLRVSLLASGLLDCLPDLADRVLICDALVYRCDLFCTRDWTTILRHRSRVADRLPFEIVSPTEWWAKVGPYAALF